MWAVAGAALCWCIRLSYPYALEWFHESFSFVILSSLFFSWPPLYTQIFTHAHKPNSVTEAAARKNDFSLSISQQHIVTFLRLYIILINSKLVANWFLRHNKSFRLLIFGYFKRGGKTSKRKGKKMTEFVWKGNILFLVPTTVSQHILCQTWIWRK